MENNKKQIVNQNYVVLKSAILENKGVVFAENKNAPQPFVTWRCHVEIDKNGQKDFNFYWGHYFSDKSAALKDFKNRIEELKEHEKTSVLQSLYSAKINGKSISKSAKNQTMER